MQLKPFLRPSGSVTRTKHLRSKCDSHFDPRRLRRLTWCYASIRRIAAALVLLYAGSTFANESPAERVTAYLVAFNSDSDMEQVSSEYWFSEMVLNPGQQSPVHLPGSTLAKQFESLRSSLKEAGWIRSEVGEIGQCQLREDFALVTVGYTRIFRDGTRRPGAALYSLGKDSSVWKISSINVIDDINILRCSAHDA